MSFQIAIQFARISYVSKKAKLPLLKGFSEVLT